MDCNGTDYHIFWQQREGETRKDAVVKGEYLTYEGLTCGRRDAPFPSSASHLLIIRPSSHSLRPTLNKRDVI